MNDKIKKALSEKVEISPYDHQWPQMFQDEKNYLENYLPKGLIDRIEHFGSTAVPGLAAKPIIDILIEVKSLLLTKEKIVPLLEKQGYDYFWRPTFGDHTPPFYAWFIKRNQQGVRTHHIHMVERHFEHWERLFFRDYLIDFPARAKDYANLKYDLSKKFKYDRIAYTEAKTSFIKRVTIEAKKYYHEKGYQA